MSSLRRLFVAVLLLSGVCAAPRREPLLAPSAGQTPTDTATDGATKFAIEPRAELGGPALKVTFAPGDTFGDRIAKVTNWKPFSALEFSVWNPATTAVKLTLVVRHRRSTSFATRVDYPLTLKPGRTDVRIGLDELANTNGSAPDLANIVRWYLAAEEGKSPLLWFTDLVLTGDEAAPTAGGGGGTGTWRVTGKIGEQPVDLLVTPAGAPAPVAGKVAWDPARVARLKAAKLPPITGPVAYNTPAADALCSALEVFPPDNPWNQLVTDWPVAPNSKAIVASIGADKPLRYNMDMGFVLVPPTQPRVDLKILDYPDESDKGPYPLPDIVPIEGWPATFTREPRTAHLTLDDVQRDKLGQGGDRHASVVDPVNRMLYEFYQLKRTATGWQAACEATFDLKSNALRPLGWTSTDAAGLPIFPAIVRYDEFQRGVIEHALRFTVKRSRRAFVSPATHYASKLEDESLPRMGERFRLRRDFDTSGFSPEVKAILVALQRYGMFMADNGMDWGMSVSGDERIPVMHAELRKVKGSDFEVVVAPAER